MCSCVYGPAGEKSDFTYSTATAVKVFVINLKLYQQLKRHVSGLLLKELVSKLDHRSACICSPNGNECESLCIRD